MATPARFSNKPHVFDGKDFSHWCSSMQSYIMAEDYDIWRKVSHAYVIPEAINTAAKKTAFEQNCKARNILLSGFSHSDYDRVAHLQTAHEIWVALSNFHQGTNNIKQLRRDLFKNEYIKFEMKPGEALDDYLFRFNKILSDLRSVDSSYDANYPQSEISRHFLNGLDMSIWEMKVTSIQESVNMSTLTLDSLYTKLKRHEMNVLSRKVDSKSNALVSSSSSLDVDASSSKSSFLAVFNATSDDQLEQIEEEDLALVANRIARAMNNARNRKRGGPNRCFECGSIDHLCSHCPKLRRGKREDKDGEKTNNNKPNNNKSKGSYQGRKIENLRKASQQVCAAFEPLSDVDGESGDDDKGKNVSDVCFMARGESDTEYENNEVSAFEEAINILSVKNKKCEKMYRKKEFIIESLKSEIDRLKSLIPNDDDYENCEVLMNEISKIRDVNAAHDLKNRSSLACSFALHTRTLDELFLTKKLLQKYQIAFHASLMFNMISAKKLKQPHDVLDCSTCNLNKMKLKDALGRVEYIEDVVKNNEILSCPKCRKNKGVMVDCENCANLEKEDFYLKNSLLRFSYGKKNLNMILDQSKVLVLEVVRFWKPVRPQWVPRSDRQPVRPAEQPRSDRALGRPTVQRRSDRPPVRSATVPRSDRPRRNFSENSKIDFARGYMPIGSSGRVSQYWIPKFLLSSNPSTEALTSACVLALVARKENVWIVDSVCSRHMTGDKNWFSSLKKASKTESIIFSDAATSAVLATGLVKVNEKFELKNVALVEDLKYNLLSVSQIVDENFEVHFKKTGSKVFDSCGDSVLNISRYGRVFKADFENPVSPVITCLVAKFDKDVMFWHRRLGHVGFDHLTRLSGLDLVRGLPKLKKDLDLGEDGRIFEDESDYDDNDEVGSAGQTGRQAGQTAGTPPEEVYVKQPPGFENPDFPNHVFKLSKALYGLKQAPRAWFLQWERLTKRFLFLKHGDNQLFVQIYVDDIIFGCSTHALVVDFAETMRREFEMSMMGELSYFLGLQIKQTPQGTFVYQMKYMKDLLRRFKMENCKPISTPIGSTAVLDPDEDGEAVDQKEYRSMIGSLLYLTASRPDIQFAMCLCARFQASPRASHRQAVKRIMRYLNHTLKFGIWYSTSFSIYLSGYSDADFGGCRIDRKSTSGTCHFLGISLIAWSSRKQSSVAQSTAKSEYVAAASCCSQIPWLLSILKDYGLTFEKVHLFCDNTIAINIAKNPVQHSRTKHIDIRFHFLRDHVEKGDVELQFLDTKLQIADIFTKPLDSNRFAFLRGELGIIHPFAMV
uniref:Retrotransposon protein, putative, unclassified n=1 Tax=Oryza sativa subsp. japonica TaxID=39947 RepID=Q2QRW3_ORYSJ|nr:retrotransposon protein, putative, unclassified [Oryza sativa Japonica Group]